MRRSSVLLSALLCGAPLAAQDAAPPAVYQSVLECRLIADGTARLACFDRAVASFAAAEASNDVIVVSKTEVERRERARFGSGSGPSLASPDGQPVDSIETTLAAVRADRFGKLTIALPDGAVWQQLDGQPPRRDPKVGSPVVLRRGSFGSFLVSIDGQPALRMKRVDDRR